MLYKNAPHDQSGSSQMDFESGSDGVLRRWVIMRHSSVWRPPTDIYELDNRLIVLVEVAGMRDADFDITLQGPVLLIRGIRERVTPPASAYHQLEISFGEFRAEVNLPWPISREDVTASYQDGFLRVELPRAEIQRVHVVDVHDVEAESGSDQANHDVQTDVD